MDLVLAIILGMLFGFVLQRISAADPNKIVGMLRLTDLHLIKTILLGVALSSSILFIGIAVGLIDSGHLNIKSMHLGVIVGAIILAIGWAISGFCPGTALVAAGSGRKDALFYILGGLCGAGFFIVMYEPLTTTPLFEPLWSGKTTLAETGICNLFACDQTNPIILVLVLNLILVIIAARLPPSIR